MCQEIQISTQIWQNEIPIINIGVISGLILKE
jgi:hypothetical protein